MSQLLKLIGETKQIGLIECHFSSELRPQVAAAAIYEPNNPKCDSTFLNQLKTRLELNIYKKKITHFWSQNTSSKTPGIRCQQEFVDLCPTNDSLWR